MPTRDKSFLHRPTRSNQTAHEAAFFCPHDCEELPEGAASCSLYRDEDDMSTEPDRFMRRPEVLAMLGVSDSTLYAMIRARKFPPSCKIGERAVGWSHCAVMDWITAKAAESGVGTAYHARAS